MQLDQFKNFVRKHPSLADTVASKKQTWQDLYNLYALYGEDSAVWDPYFQVRNSSSVTNHLDTSTSGFSLKNLWNLFDQIDMNELQKGITSLQKGLGYASELFTKDSGASSVRESTYEPRPIHKYFDD